MVKHWLRSNRGFILFMLCFGIFRTAIADWNPVPSGSMRPTILEGDVVLVNRVAYDLKLPLTDVSLVRLGEPQRGDIITFSSPADGTRLIKRVMALPGDVVAMDNEVLSVNGQVARYDRLQPAEEMLTPGVSVRALRATESVQGTEHAVQFLEGANGRHSFAAITVPEGHYFVLGDNRDNSADSRYIGFVPREKLIGRAMRVLVSADITDRWQPRFSRWIAPL
ncbi:MAG: signal peptidase I [Hydrogenophaga sp.]|nr:signal peptidase I [Hydrogenophaga sp.]